MQRTQGGWRLFFSGQALRSRPFGPLIFVVCVLAAVWSARAIEVRGNLRGTRASLEATAVGIEQRWLARVAEPRLSYSRIDVDIELDCDARRVDVRGTLQLVNSYPVALQSAVFTIDPQFDMRRFELEGASGPPRRDASLVEYPLAQPLEPGGRLRLELDWGGSIGPGWAANGGSQGTFLHRDAAFLS